jgi:hypothetical protein
MNPARNAARPPAIPNENASGGHLHDFEMMHENLSVEHWAA